MWRQRGDLTAAYNSLKDKDNGAQLLSGAADDLTKGKSKVFQLGKFTLDVRTSSIGEQCNTGTHIQVEGLSSEGFKIQLDLASAGLIYSCYSPPLIRVLYQMTSRDPF